MSTLTTAWMMVGVWGSGFLVGAVVASGRRRLRGNGNCEPMPPAPPYSSAAIALQAKDAQRIYRGAMWREKGSDAWQPLGEPIDFAELARQQLNRTSPPPIKPEFPPPRVIRGGLL